MFQFTSLESFANQNGIDSVSSPINEFVLVKDSLKKEKQKSVPSKSKEKKESKTSAHDPGKAGVYSAILPGLGQAYNKKYWKIPIIYALGGFTIYTARQQHLDYKLFRKVNLLKNLGFDISGYQAELTARGKPNTGLIEAYRDEARNSRDIYFLYTGVVHALNIVDALVDGHLKEFDVSPDLSLKIDPVLMVNAGQTHQGMRISLRF